MGITQCELRREVVTDVRGHGVVVAPGSTYKSIFLHGKHRTRIELEGYVVRCADLYIRAEYHPVTLHVKIVLSSPDIMADQVEEDFSSIVFAVFHRRTQDLRHGHANIQLIDLQIHTEVEIE